MGGEIRTLEGDARGAEEVSVGYEGHFRGMLDWVVGWRWISLGWSGEVGKDGARDGVQGSRVLKLYFIDNFQWTSINSCRFKLIEL